MVHKKKKIGILTFHFSSNYGAVWQAYALRFWLCSRGHVAEFVNYRPSHVEDGGNFIYKLALTAIRANVKILYLKIVYLIKKIFGNRVMEEAFVNFRSAFLKVSGREFSHVEELEEVVKDYDVLIAGSDQIWNPSLQYGLDRAYFLDFPGYGGKKISYAASFGSAKIQHLESLAAGRYLAQLDSISVREVDGVKMVEQLAGRAATCVLDPTCLLNNYSELLRDTDKPIKNPFVFCYALRTDVGVREVALEVGRRLKKEVVTPSNPLSRWRPIGRKVYVGPMEWLKMAETAEYIITNSFHGTVFSIVFEKPFIAVALPGVDESRNNRVTSLLDRLGLIHRLVRPGDERIVEAIMNTEIDWNVVRMRLAIERISSEAFLDGELVTA